MDESTAPAAKNTCYCPTQMYRAPGEEGDKLRHHILLMMVFHVFFLILNEIWLYTNFVFLPFFLEFVYLYICYQCWMTLNKLYVYLYVALMIGQMPMYFWLVIGQTGSFGSAFMCFIEICFYFYVGGFITCRRLSFMNGSAPGWVAGQSGITKDKFEMKLFIGAIKTIF